MAFTSVIQLSGLDGSSGFRLDGVAVEDMSGRSVSSAGDVNGDGFADLIIGAPYAGPNGGRSGSSYVVFGKPSGFASSLDLSALDGSNGFRFDGVAADDYSGRSVASAGDVNGDGFDDVILGASGADPGGSLSGSSYVVFGKASGFPSALDLSALDGSNGFRLDGAAAYDSSSFSVASAGDVNGDGFDDVILGALGADPNGSSSGSSYVVFGKSTGFPSSLELSALDGTNGFRLDGAAVNDRSGRSVASAGDVNGDGFDDVIVGASGADPSGSQSGSSYVVFGKPTGFASALDLSALDGSNGFRLDGVAASDISGHSVSSAGDVNGDGFADLIIGAPGADPNGSFSGSSYVVFGKSSGFASAIDLWALDGTNGFRLDGVAASDESGRSVAAAGDVNGDGFADLVIGAPYAGHNFSSFGASYVVFGKAGGFASSLDLSALDGWNGFRLDGAAAGDQSGFSVSSAGDVNGDGFADLVIGAQGADPNGNFSGASFVVFGASDRLIGTDGNDTLIGGPFDDLIMGLGGDDSLSGLGGNDTIAGGPGADLVDGGEGTDTADYADSDEAIDVDLAAGTASGGDATGDTLIGFENIAGSAHADRLTGDAGANRLLGRAGADTLIGGAGADLLDGGADSDTADYSGSPGRVTIDLSMGLAVFNDAAGDTLIGIENLVGSIRADSLTGGDGANVLDGGRGNDTLTGLGGDDLLVGGPRDDLLLGGDGNDTLAGGRGNDTIDGGKGIDTADYSGFGGKVTVKLNTGEEQFTGAPGTDVIVLRSVENLIGGETANLFTGSPRANHLQGNGGNDSLFGLGGNDTLDGGIGNDRVRGGNGDDFLIGGHGRDTLIGGAGADTFDFNDVIESMVGSRRDVIKDFTQGEDVIDLTDIDADTSTGGDDAFTFIGTGPFSATAGELRQVDTPLRILVEGDVDGDGAADFKIRLTTTGLVLSDGDFWL